MNNLTTADAGQYYCRLYHNKNDYEDASVINLSPLNIFASSPVTELMIGSTVTLVCELHSPGSCGKSVRVIWVSETGDPLQGDRYKLSESECSSGLTVTLERSDRNMKWRCQLTVEGKLKASHSYTTSVPGVSGSELTVYSSAGELVSLPCNLHGSFNCSSITWIGNSGQSKESIELVAHGAVKDENQQIARRLRVGTNCSLDIINLTTADTGWYNCRLYSNHEDYADVSVYLSILNISASSPVTELKIGSTVTLVCKLHSPEPCGKSVRVSWVSETGAPLQGNRYKLSESECSSGLTVTRERSDRNMKWRCQLTVEGKQKASHSYTTIFPGVSGSEPTVYSSVGELVSLPCNLHGSFNCYSITWNWNSGRSEGSIELVTLGEVNAENQQIARRLRVGTNCSLHINNLTTADAGQYDCQLYHNRNHFTDSSVINLSLLNISVSSPVTELKIGSTVTLVCKLHSFEPCGKSIRVSWVSETGAPLQGDRYKLSESECSSSLTVTLERSDRNMKWRCQLTVEGKLKASHSYTTSFPGVSGSEPTVYSSARELVSHSYTTSFPGTSGSEPTVYSSVGELVSLSFTYHGSFNSSSTTCAGRNGQSRSYIELLIHGKVRDENQEKSGKLRVGPNCSLHMNNLTTADVGQYYCRLYHNKNDYEDASVINLSLLNVFASSPVTELKIGSTVTLVCELHSPGSCGKSVRVSWVSETGVPLQGNRHKLSESECSSGLTVTLEHSERNMKWRCQLTEEGKLKASHSYTTSFPGVSGSEPTVYSSVEELVSLPCNLHGSFNCSSITWIWGSAGSQESIELVTLGVVNAENQQIARRLRVGTNCSLHINDLTSADAGWYHCHSDHITHCSEINLSLLNIFASSPVTELKIGSTVTLVCKLHSSDPCGKSIRVSWVNETGAPLQGSRHKLSESECSSNLTVTLERSDRNMKWRCQLTEEGKLKASHSYTTIFTDGTYRELPARLVVFFLLLAIPPIIGTIFYIRRRKHAHTDHMPSGPSLDYVNTEMLDRNAVPNFSVTQ
ncbi:titin-like isoform X3 [Anguilla rostrata]|uniref:titin-like isoform X3 n=1 Tax=Anguilla rostrata TaxID=7938 RepID=UPI0030D4DDA2